MKTVKIAELKDALSEHLRAVEQGAEVVVTDRNRPIARIVPIVSQRSLVEVVPAGVPFSSLHRAKYKPTRWDVDSGKLLAEERRER